jgi:uncharacterized protein (UPF0332 family)
MSEFKEAEFWLESAKHLGDMDSREKSKYTVMVAQCIHSIIRANDALTLRFLNIRGLRHDDAPRLFLKLIQQNKIPSKFSNLRTTVLTPAIQMKSKADYKGIEISKAEAGKWVRNAEKFLAAARECLK